MLAMIYRAVPIETWLRIPHLPYTPHISLLPHTLHIYARRSAFSLSIITRCEQSGLRTQIAQNAYISMRKKNSLRPASRLVWL